MGQGGGIHVVRYYTISLVHSPFFG